jgi:hypothetical protein
MKKIIRLLELLTTVFPPGPGQHHAIYLDDGILKITIFYGDIYYPFHLDSPADLDAEPEDLVESIKTLLGQ